ncbi:M24 family metallopeptidase [Undibacterium flavidum]|uniref:Aminopeptidase P family protein n=1 Tax=Undibacterium flavidum TaxID=2762297 RepID=A0ABR6YDF5_9BURK|nr:M24 family metallopeptidase [Undibacterium flavidum]MBC3874564.1 aminopeptidase P family protein [Undibacterium flavidum]
MPDQQKIQAYRDIQDRTKLVMSQLPLLFSTEDSEHSIAEKAYQLLCEQGLTETWYYNCPALVLAGSRSCLSISGKEYQANHEKLGGKNLISIDLSPSKNGVWGDYSRSFAFEFGTYVEQAKTLEYQNGLNFLKNLHEEMLTWVRPDTSFHQLFQWANVRIRESGFVNLDFRSNVGHSLEIERENRQYIQANNTHTLASVDFFSFEPFVRVKGGLWGFKHEDIFYFDDSERLVCL